MMLKVLLSFILILWLIKTGRDILFWVYLWQLKEYRRDRMRAHFELKSARDIFLQKLYLAKLLLLLSSAFLFIDIWQFFFQILGAALYGALGAKSAYAIFRRNLRKPVFTKKATGIVCISALTVSLWGIFAYFKFSAMFFFLALLIVDILLPAVVTAIVGLAKFPSDVSKKRVIEAAKKKRETLKDMFVIGITGSYGKTSMKEFLAHILAGKLKVIKTKENENSEIGIADFLLKSFSSNYEVAIIEMGAYKEGEIARVCDIVRPQMGILTGINEQHVSLFGSIEQTMKAKYELIQALPRQGLAIFNGENDLVHALYEKTIKPKRMYALRSFSVSAKPDATSEKIDITNSGMKFYVRLGNERELFETSLLGKHNVLNILGATIAARELGMSLKEIKDRVKTLTAPPHTLKVFQGINGSTIIDDSYSANSRGVTAALEVLDLMKGNKKILVLYPLIELGKEARDVHRRIGIHVNKVCDLCILTSSDFARDIAKNAPNTETRVIHDPQKIIDMLEKIVAEGDIVLFENRIPEEIKNALIAPPIKQD